MRAAEFTSSGDAALKASGELHAGRQVISGQERSWIPCSGRRYELLSCPVFIPAVRSGTGSGGIALAPGSGEGATSGLAYTEELLSGFSSSTTTTSCLCLSSKALCFRQHCHSSQSPVIFTYGRCMAALLSVKPGRSDDVTPGEGAELPRVVQKGAWLTEESSSKRSGFRFLLESFSPCMKALDGWLTA
ncbi:hypothetical protein PAMA_011784 [Pampus argenteus]